MKQISNILILAVIVLLTAACSSKTTVTVYGTPGESIYTPDRQYLATIQDSGNTKVEISSKNYYAYLLSRNEADNDTTAAWVPFALDIKQDRHNATRTACGFSYAVDLVGLALITAGGVDSSDSGSLGWYLGGIATCGIGTAITVKSFEKMSWYPYQYNFRYLNTQLTNSDVELEK